MRTLGSPAAIRWPAESIWEAVAPGLPGFTVEILPEIDSTNSELMRRIRAGRSEPTLLVAERQNAGRGRLGRGWQAEVGASLTFSLALPLAPADWSGLSLAVGASVADSLHPELQLKWPNDVWLHGHKLGGILIETTSADGQRHAVIGIGLNVGPREADGLSTPPAWLQQLLPAIDAPAALQRVAAPLVAALQRFERHGFAAFSTQFAARDLLRDGAVRLSDGTSGVARGVDLNGALLVEAGGTLHKITSAEVSVRPQNV